MMTLTKTSELTGIALDWAVDKCKGFEFKLTESFIAYHNEGERNYSTDWAQGGPIIEREKIGLFWDSGNGLWSASNPIGTFCESGLTPLEAAMRCYVVSKLGDEVEIPKELT